MMSNLNTLNINSIIKILIYENGTDLAAINTYQEISSNLVIQEEKSNYLYSNLLFLWGITDINFNNLARKEDY